MDLQSTQHVPLDVRLVAKIGISVAFASFLCLLALLYFIGDGKGNSYGEIIGQVGVVKESLMPAMLIFGLTMVTFAGVTTWLLALVASFRIAGPLFRIARNIEQQIAQGTVKPMPIRTTDRLQEVWHAFEGSVTQLRDQQQALRSAMHGVEQVLTSHGGSRLDPSLMMPLVAQLKKVEQRVKL